MANWMAYLEQTAQEQLKSLKPPEIIEDEQDATAAGDNAEDEAFKHLEDDEKVVKVEIKKEDTKYENEKQTDTGEGDNGGL